MPHMPGHSKEEDQLINYFTDEQAESYRKWLLSLPLGQIGVSMDTPLFQHYFAQKGGFREEAVSRQKDARNKYTLDIFEGVKNEFLPKASPTAAPPSQTDQAIANMQAQSEASEIRSSQTPSAQFAGANIEQGPYGPYPGTLFEAQREAYGGQQASLPASGNISPGDFDVFGQVGGNVAGAQREDNVFSRAQTAARDKLRTIRRTPKQRGVGGQSFIK